MRINSKNKANSVKNKNFDNQSVISSDYVFLKNGNIKRKRNKNSYFETFLEKRRMAAEFAQSKRCYSTVSTKIANLNRNNNKLSLNGLQDIINMNNLKHNLPGKAKPIIDNTNNLNNISNDFFIQKNINNKNNNNLSQPNFDEIRHLTNKSNANNEYNNNLSPPYELDNDKNEETSKFGNQNNKIIQKQNYEIIDENTNVISNNKNINSINYYKLQSNEKNKKNNTYIKKRPRRDDNSLYATLSKNKNQELNYNNNSQVENSISFRNDINNNKNNIKKEN